MKHLAVEISNDHFRFTLLADKQIQEVFTGTITGRIASEKKDDLSEQFNGSFLKGKEFDEVTLAFFTERSTLVPNALFNESNPKEIFGFCFGEHRTEHNCDYNRLSEHGLVNIYEIPAWVKSFFILKYPRITMQHIGSHSIRQALDSNAFRLKASIGVYENKFQLLLTKHNKLEFYSYFDQQSAQDIVYHLAFVLQQKEMFSEEGTIELTSGMGVPESLIQDVERELGFVGNLKKMKVVHQSDHFAKSQLLCVL